MRSLALLLCCACLVAACGASSVISAATAVHPRLTSIRAGARASPKAAAAPKGSGAAQDLAHAEPVFTEKDAQEGLDVCLKLKDEDPTKLGWEQLHKDSVMGFYRKKLPDSGHFMYLLKGTISDVRPNMWLKASTDPEQRPQWDPTIRFIRTLPISNQLPQEHRLLWRSKYNWPISDREYIYARKLHKFPRHNSVLTLSKATNEEFPATKDVIRVCTAWEKSFMCAPNGLDSNGVQFITMYYDTDGIPFSPALVKRGGKQVSELIQRLHKTAQDLQAKTSDKGFGDLEKLMVTSPPAETQHAEPQAADVSEEPRRQQPVKIPVRDTSAAKPPKMSTEEMRAPEVAETAAEAEAEAEAEDEEEDEEENEDEEDEGDEDMEEEEEDEEDEDESEEENEDEGEQDEEDEDESEDEADDEDEADEEDDEGDEDAEDDNDE